MRMRARRYVVTPNSGMWPAVRRYSRLIYEVLTYARIGGCLYWGAGRLASHSALAERTRVTRMPVIYCRTSSELLTQFGQQHSFSRMLTGSCVRHSPITSTTCWRG